MDLERFLEMTDDEMAALVMPMEDTLPNLGKAALREDASRVFYMNGREIDRKYYRMIQSTESMGEDRFDDLYRVYGCDGEFLGVSETDRNTGALRALKIIGDR